MKGMIQFILDDKSRTALLEAVHPKHEVVVAHHVTIAFKPEAGNPVLGQFRNGEELTIKAIGHAEDELIQAVSVRIFSTNEHPHITISHTYDTGPVYSNELLQTVPVIPFEEPLELTGRIKFVYFK